MKRSSIRLVCLLLLWQTTNAEAFPRRDFGIIKNQSSPHAKLRSVDLVSVRWTDGFWAHRYRQTSEVTLRRLWELADAPEAGHVLDNMRIAAGLQKGEFVARTRLSSRN